MKKRIFLVIMILLLTTGCTCQYNLNINGNNYQERTSISSSNSSELSNLNRNWEIAIDKDIYNIGVDEASDMAPNSDIYKTTFSNNILTFSNNFTSGNISNSTAASICYNQVTVTNYSGSTIISTSSKVNCFDKYPTLSSVVVNITVDRTVTKHNADRVNGSTYTWNLTKSSASNKAINLVLDNSDNNSTENNPSNNEENNNRKSDYSMYIFAGILLIVFLIGYFVFNKIKSKDEAI